MDEKDKKAHQPHDRFFRRMMADPKLAKAFVQAALSEEIVQDLNIDSLSSLDTQLPSGQVDFVCRIDLKDAEEFVLVLVEHQSYPDRMMPIRIRRYTNELMNHYSKVLAAGSFLPAVIPLVFYTGKGAFGHTGLDGLLSGSKAMKRMLLQSEFLLLKPDGLLHLFPYGSHLALAMEVFSLIGRPNRAGLLPMLRRLDKMGTGGQDSFFPDLQAYVFRAIEYRIGTTKLNELKSQLKHEKEGQKMPTITLAELFTEIGREEGEEHAFAKVIANMEEQGLSPELIVKCTKLSVKDIERLKSSQLAL